MLIQTAGGAGGDNRANDWMREKKWGRPVRASAFDPSREIAAGRRDQESE